MKLIKLTHAKLIPVSNIIGCPCAYVKADVYINPDMITKVFPDCYLFTNKDKEYNNLETDIPFTRIHFVSANQHFTDSIYVAESIDEIQKLINE